MNRTLKNSSETKKLAGSLARHIVRDSRRESPPSPKLWRAGALRPRNATVVALIGDLGAGKTTFAQGFALGLGIRQRITSPTFIMVRRYALPVPRSAFHVSHSRFHVPRFTNFFHIDCYRIKKAKELASLGVKKILNDPHNIVLIEWADKIKKMLPPGARVIRFAHGGHENHRHVDMLE